MSEISVVVIQPVKPSSWGSCLTIIPNLVQSYALAIRGVPFCLVDYGTHLSPFQTLDCAKAIHKIRPTHLAFVDHVKHPLDLLLALEQVYGESTWPQLIFHVFGDFTLNTPLWRKCEDLLRGREVKIVCASQRQNELVAGCLNNGSEFTMTCPFPVDENNYFFDELERNHEREKRGFTNGRLVLTYTGRLSLQKNCLRLIWELARSSFLADKDWCLELAGNFDDLGSPFFGVTLGADHYRQGFESMLRQLPIEIRERVHHGGHLGGQKLRALYNASDLFISFSTHHDEDFGMSPAEALLCGCPTLLSDWGGFQSFAACGASEGIGFFPTALTKSGPALDLSALDESLGRLLKLGDASDRRERADTYAKALGINHVAARVLEVVKEKPARFAGFSESLHRHASLMTEPETAAAPFRVSENESEDGNGNGREKTELHPRLSYQDFYSSYVTPAHLSDE